MPYGIDTDAFEYVHDAHGKRTKALVPVSTLNALVEFWCAARRAQSDALETKTRPGLRPAPLRVMHAVPAPVDDGPPGTSSSVPFAHDHRWQALTEKLPQAPSLEAPEALTASPSSKPTKKRIFFAREFKAPIPVEVSSLISKGTYFIKAWRMYRELSLDEVAELHEKTTAGASYHEQGFSHPTPRVLKSYADIFDCTVEQLTVKPGTNTMPWLDVIEGTGTGKPAIEVEHCAPEGTYYPAPVKAHLLAGKSPMLAWRLHRNLSLAQLAEAYGASTGNIKVMEGRASLRPKTVDKLCVILGCKPEQLLKPEWIEHEHDESPASRRITEAMRASA